MRSKHGLSVYVMKLKSIRAKRYYVKVFSVNGAYQWARIAMCEPTMAKLNNESLQVYDWYPNTSAKWHLLAVELARQQKKKQRKEHAKNLRPKTTNSENLLRICVRTIVIVCVCVCIFCWIVELSKTFRWCWSFPFSFDIHLEWWNCSWT